MRVQQPGSAAYDGYMLRTNQLAGTDQVFIDRIDNSAVVNRLTVNQELAAGDVLLLRAKGALLEAWRNDGSAWSRLGVVNDPTYAAAGFTGVGIRGTTGRVDDFGARTDGAPPPDTEPPSAPGTLTATALSSEPDRPLLGAGDGQRRRDALPDRALLGRGLLELRRDRRPARRRPISDIGLSRLHRLLLPRARRQDAADNEGPYSNTASRDDARLRPTPRLRALPARLTATATSTSQIDLSWPAATDNVAVTLYRIERCQGAGCSNFAEIATTASRATPTRGLSASTSLLLPRARRRTPSRNVGPYSNTASARRR